MGVGGAGCREELWGSSEECTRIAKSTPKFSKSGPPMMSCETGWPTKG